MHPRIVRDSRAVAPCTLAGLILCLIFSMALPAQGQQVHQLLYDNSIWADQNLGGPQSDSRTGIAAISTPGAQHVFYLGSDEDVHQLFNVGGGWSDQDLTTLTAGPKALAKSAVAGFSLENFQYVYYVAANLDVHQLLYNNLNWTDSDLTSQAGAAQASSASKIVAFATTPNDALHVYYMTSNKHIHQLYNTGTAWADQDLSAQTHGGVGNGGWLGGFNIDNFQYVFYVSSNGDIHELYYNNLKWADRDLTALTGNPALPARGGVAAMVIPGTNNVSVYFVAGDHHLRQISSSNNKTWSSSDLTNLGHGPAASTVNGVTAFATTPNNQIHVYYVSQNHVDQMFFNGTSWSNQDLTSLTLGGLANGTTGMSGFSVENFQYVYYVAN